MDNISDQQLSFGYWLVTHKLQIKKFFLILLIAINAALWGYVIYGTTVLVANYGASKSAAEILSQRLYTREDYQAYNEALPPDVIGQYVIAAGEGRYDLAAQAENANSQWAMLSLEYRFAWTGGQTGYYKSFLMPGERKFLLALGIESGILPSDASIEFRNIRYLRMTGRRNLPPGSELGFEVSGISFVPAGTRQLRGGKTSASSTVLFEATNATPYDLWSVPFKAVLYQGNRVVGAGSVPVSRFLSGQTREVEISWVRNFPQVTGVVVQPDVNWLDEDAFMPVQ